MRRAIVLAALLAASAAAAPPPTGVEPQPFRLDAALAGSSIGYNAESYLLRWSYRLDFPLVGSGEPWDTGLWAAAGSVRASEFYSRAWLHERIALEDWGTLEFRHARDEDLDGRHDRTLVGMGWRFAGAWTATLLGDVPGDKELIDAQLELAWAEGRERFRLALVLTDFQYDAKQSAARYDAEPVTLFAERWWSWDGVGELYAYGNANLQTRWRDLASGTTLADRSTQAGIGLRRALGPQRALRAYLRGADGARRTDDGLGARTLAREHREAAFQHELPVLGRPSWWGLRALRLDEDHGGSAPLARVKRRELLLYVGSRWRLGERLTLAPELALDRVELHDERLAPALQRERATLGKLSLPLEVVLDQARGARLVFDVGLKLHELKFGGAQVVISVPL